MSWIGLQPPHLPASSPGLTGTFLMWPSNRCSIWAMSRFWGSRKNWMTSRREFSSPRSWVGRVNHSLEVKVGVRRPEITSVLIIVVISICENVFAGPWRLWQYVSVLASTVFYLCRGVYMHLLNLSGYEHNCVCVSQFWWIGPCVSFHVGMLQSLSIF